MKPDDQLPGLWRSLTELEAGGRSECGHELPWRTSDAVEGMDRRDFARLMGAALAMAGLAGCTRQPPEKIVPYVNQPPEITQGKPLFFATAMPAPFFGDSLGLVVKSHMGHPIKVEGNPKHPSSLGGTDPRAQASLFTLYDPDRSQTINFQGRISNWMQFIAGAGEAMAQQNLNKGAKLRLLTGTVISPTLGRQIQALIARYPAMKWYQWEPAGRDNVRLGAQMAFGRFVNPYYFFDKADVILALDGDFLFCGPGNARYAHDFSQRRASRDRERMNRLYVAEPGYSNTGMSADHRFRVRQSEMEGCLRGIAQAVGAPGGAAPPSEHAKWVNVVAKDLMAHRGASLVVAGEFQPPQLHALTHAINAALGNAGSTVVYTDPVEVNPSNEMESMRALTAEMRSGQVDMLVMIGVNPGYDAPSDLDFAGALQKVRVKVHQGLYDDETAVRSDWHVPQTHFLEEWSDTVAFDGTATIVQPLIAPLYQGRSAHDMVATLLGQPDVTAYDTIRAYWQGQAGGGDFETAWRQWLHDGVIPGTALPPRQVALAASAASALAPSPASVKSQALELLFRPDPNIWDGRWANNSYLQELPKPTTKLTWDAVAMVSNATAKKIDTYSTGLVQLEHRGRRVKFPIWVQPGLADGTVLLTLGYGRRRAGRTGNIGFDAYPLRTSEAPWAASGVEVRPTKEYYQLAETQQHWGMDGRYPVRMATLGKYKEDPDFAHKEPFEETPRKSDSLYPEWRYTGYKWGMSIDLNACVGCQACIMACNLENNLPVVGKTEVFKGRMMHWLRVDRYFQGPAEDPRGYYQPTPCMHCENAPCELVCPVDATTHSTEGINQMVYNRCVGTRYCSNNCPYKVRRFNFFLYSNWYEQSLTLMRNPDVSVRSRGVMEKCTYCIQRIEQAKIQAQIENRGVRDGEILTACQQACPTQAIIFGDLNDKNSQVWKLKRQSLDYGLLAELNTRPRTTYLAKVLNLNPELEKELV